MRVVVARLRNAFAEVTPLALKVRNDCDKAETRMSCQPFVEITAAYCRPIKIDPYPVTASVSYFLTEIHSSSGQASAF